MNLYGSTRSPFVRKVLVFAHEAGLQDLLTLVPKTVAILSPDPDVCAVNPLGQIPALILDDGTAVYDSLVICEWLDQQRPGSGLIPAAGAARIDALRRHAEGDGVLDTFVRWFSERRRADHPLTADYVEQHRRKVLRVMDSWEAQAGGWHGQPVDIGAIAIGCALAYADFRFGQVAWRADRPDLAAWYAGICERPSFAATTFRDA
jgi:glutathione S-transferase